MRRMGLAAALVAGTLAGCGPKVNVDPSPYEYDDPAAGAPTAPAVRTWESRPEATIGRGVRRGTIDRTALLAVLDQGPGQFLRQLEVTSAMDGDRFIGWQLVQLLDRQSTLATLDLVAGDVLVAVNGAPLSRPDQLMAVWDKLRTADAVTCDLLRGDARFQIRFEIQPPVGRVPPDLAPAASAGSGSGSAVPAAPGTPVAPTTPATPATLE